MAKKSSSKAVKRAAPKAVKKNVAKVAKKTVKTIVKKASSLQKQQASKKVLKPVAKSAAKIISNRNASKNTTKVAKKTESMAVKNNKTNSSKKAVTAVTKAKVKTFLSKKELDEFKKILLEKRKSLIGDMAGMRGSALGMNLQDSSGDLSNMPTHLADIGSDNFEHEFTLELLESERDLLREIDDALDRIEDGTFGICLGTGEPISIARLKARPWCQYSIEYKRMLEKGLVSPNKKDDNEQNDDEE